MMQVVARGVTSSSRASTSAACPFPCRKRVFVDLPNALSRSNHPCRGKSIAASLPSDSTRPCRGQKKISKRERCAIVESFVDKYRATNAGRFPTVSLAQKETGGSYYTVREIIQELKYKSKFPPVKEMEEFSLEKLKEDKCTSSDARKEVSFTKTEEGEVSVSFKSCTFQEQSLEISASFGNGIINGANTDKTPADVTGSVGLQSVRMESNVEENMSKSFPGEPDGSIGDVDGQKEAEEIDRQEFSINEDRRGITTKSEQEEALPKESVVWQNLKSLARGLISFWKKM